MSVCELNCSLDNVFVLDFDFDTPGAAISGDEVDSIVKGMAITGDGIGSSDDASAAVVTFPVRRGTVLAEDDMNSPGDTSTVPG